MLFGSHSHIRRSKKLMFESRAGPAARKPKVGSSITGLRVRTELMKFR